jgi:protein KRI1
MSLKERPAKRAKLLDDDASSSVSEEETSANAHGFQINSEYAARFEHNKKRAEKHRLEEKFKTNGKRSRDDEGEEEDSSSDETEDDDAELADVDLDKEIFDTLEALKKKDPRIYDKDAKFYKDWETADVGGEKAKKEKPMYLQDYHRENLLAGHAGEEEVEEVVPKTYQEEQDDARRQLVGNMHATAARDGDGEDSEDDFLVAKTKPQHDVVSALPKTKVKRITNDDIKAADRDPETYLSNFMAARAWLAPGDSAYAPLESDDSDEEAKADAFEEAFNMRFEDPDTANETLRTFGRDVGQYGFRREEKTGRQKARDREKERKEAEKREREEERARLRKLKLDDAEEKLKKIQEAAGLRGADVNLAEWRNVIEGDFDDDEWDMEMKRRFGDRYYAAGERDADGPDGEEGTAKRTVKKPKWNDDIDIKDLVPEFEDEEAKADFSLSEEESDGGVRVPNADGGDSGEDEQQAPANPKRKSKKDRASDKVEAKRAARKQRQALESLVDSALPLSHPSLATTSDKHIGFRYRATSPTSFGLSARDILFADDAQLNAYAGLKKLHGFRDVEKKRKDKKRFSKKQRLKEWRKETFGSVDGPKGNFGAAGDDQEENGAELVGQGGGVDANVREGERKKKRKRSGKKAKAGEAVGES